MPSALCEFKSNEQLNKIYHWLGCNFSGFKRPLNVNLMSVSNKTQFSEQPLILIVEDEPDLSEVFVNIFKLSGFRTLTAFNGKEALKLVKQHRPHVTMMDIHLPHMMGDELLAMLRRDQSNHNMVTIVASADSRRAGFLQEQADFVLLKPISFEQLQQLAKRIYKLALQRYAHPHPDTGELRPQTGLL